MPGKILGVGPDERPAKAKVRHAQRQVSVSKGLGPLVGEVRRGQSPLRFQPSHGWGRAPPSLLHHGSPKWAVSIQPFLTLTALRVSLVAAKSWAALPLLGVAPPRGARAWRTIAVMGLINGGHLDCPGAADVAPGLAAIDGLPPAYASRILR